MPATKKARFSRRRVIVIGLALFTLAVYFGGGWVVAPILRHRLERTVASHLHAELHMSGLRYRFPYGVTVYDASLVTHADGAEVPLFKAKRIDLILADLPRRTGPLVVKKLVLVEPVLTVTRNADGAVVGKDLVRRKDSSANTEEDRLKLSDVFRLRRLSIDKGEVRLLDESDAGHDVGWTGISVNLNLEPRSGALYAFNVAARSGPVAAAELVGTFDADALRLQLQRLHLDVELKRGGDNAQLPATLQRLLETNPIAGRLTVEGSADFPFKQLPLAKVQAAVDLTDAHAAIARAGVVVDKLTATLHISTEPFPAAGTPATTQPAGVAPRWFVDVAKLEAGTGDTTARIEKAYADFDPDGGWRAHGVLGTLTLGHDHRGFTSALKSTLDRLDAKGAFRVTALGNGAGNRADYELLVTARDATFHPPGFPERIEKIGGSLRITPAIIVADALEGSYGADRLLVTSARLPLDGLDKSVRLQEVTGSIEFAGAEHRYPKAVDEVVRLLRPRGTLAVTAAVLVPRTDPTHTGYRVGLSTDAMSLSVPSDAHGGRAALGGVKADASIDGVGPDAVVDVSRVEGTAFDGRFAGKGSVRVANPLTFNAEAHVQAVDVPQLVSLWSQADPQKPRKWGKGFADVVVTGSSPHDGKTALDLLEAKGEIELLDGDFFEVPVLRELVAFVKLPKSAGTVGQAAATFSVRDRSIDFEPVAVSAPVLGLQGFGTVGFDGALTLSVVAAPLSDWKDALKRTGIPVVSDVTGEIAGGVQRLLNGATRAMLYEFRVGGRLGQPQVATVPSPVLRAGVANLFGKMISAGKDDKLIDAVKAK